MKVKNMNRLFIEAMRHSIRLTKNIAPYLVWFDGIKNIWYAVMPLINNGVLPSLGIIMITKLNNQEDMGLWMTLFIGATAIFLMTTSVLTEFENYFDIQRSEKSFQESKMFIAKKIDQLDPARLFTGDFSEVKANFESKGWKSMEFLYQKNFSILQTLIALTFSIGIAIWLSPWVILLALIPGIYSGVSIVITNKKGLKIWDKGLHNRMLHSEYDGLVSNNRSVLQTIFHGSRSYFKNRFIQTRELMNENLLQRQKLQIKRRSVFIVINLICTIGAIIVICIPAIHGEMTIAKWPIAYAAYIGIRNGIAQLAFHLAGVISSMQEYQRYFVPFANLQPLYPEGTQNVSTLLPIKLDDVVFTYPNEKNSTLKGLSLTIEKGETVGLVGQNGGGKTTLINMLAGVYFPDSGRFSLGGIQIQNIKRSSLYEFLLVESTNNGLPKTTVREIVSASLDPKNDQLIWESLEMVGIKGFVEKLPKQLDTEIGERWKKSKLLSSGQMKRLSLASLHFKSRNPRIELVILDEPMNSIDPETKKLFYNAIARKELFPGKTVIVCLHDEQFEYLFPRLIRIKDGVSLKEKVFIPNISTIAEYQA